MKEKKHNLLFCLFIGFTMQAQSYYGGIAIRDKELEMTVLEIQNPKKGTYEVKSSWTENIETQVGIPLELILTETDINTLAYVVLRNFKKMQTTYNIQDNNIYIVASSTVDMPNNINFLIKRIKAFTNQNLEIISSSSEAKSLIKNCIPQKNYLNSMILDIGDENTKGGYISKTGDENVFESTSDIGTVTLTRKINNRIKQNSSLIFNEAIFNYLPTLRQDFSKMYTSIPQSKTKNNIYLSGGAVWAFYTLINDKVAQDNFSEIKYADIVSLKFVIENNFNKIKISALTNKAVKKVLETYSQENLICASNLLLTALEEIEGTNNKNVFFAKDSQISWLISNIVNH